MSEWQTEGVRQRARADKVPEGWKRSWEIAEENGWSEAHARCVVCAALRANRAEMRMFRINTGCRVQRVPHYKLKK